MLPNMSTLRPPYPVPMRVRCLGAEEMESRTPMMLSTLRPPHPVSMQVRCLGAEIETNVVPPLSHCAAPQAMPLCSPNPLLMDTLHPPHPVPVRVHLNK